MTPTTDALPSLERVAAAVAAHEPATSEEVRHHVGATWEQRGTVYNRLDELVANGTLIVDDSRPRRYAINQMSPTTQRRGDRRHEPRRAADATMHYATLGVLAVALAVDEASRSSEPCDLADALDRLDGACEAYRDAERELAADREVMADGSG